MNLRGSLRERPTAVSARQLYPEFAATCGHANGRVLPFAGVGDRDVYNPSVPFTVAGRTYIAGRVEPRSVELSATMFFEEGTDATWRPVAAAPVFENLQDPFVTFIGGKLVLGGVRVHWEGDRITGWHTDFFQGAGIYDLEPLTSGPEGMKDIRLLELPGGRVAIFSRPLGPCLPDGTTVRAAIGFATVDSLAALNARAIGEAPLLPGLLMPDEWGGSNQLHALKGGLIGAVGHIAWGEPLEGHPGHTQLHYYSIAFALDPETSATSPVKLIAARCCFPNGPEKRPGLADVTFTSGLVRGPAGTATLYTGLSDCQIGCLGIPDPFLPFEA